MLPGKVRDRQSVTLPVILIIANNRRQQKVTQQRMQAGQTFALYGTGSFESGFVTASGLGGDTRGAVEPAQFGFRGSLWKSYGAAFWAFRAEIWPRPDDVRYSAAMFQLIAHALPRVLSRRLCRA